MYYYKSSSKQTIIVVHVSNCFLIIFFYPNAAKATIVFQCKVVCMWVENSKNVIFKGGEGVAIN